MSQPFELTWTAFCWNRRFHSLALKVKREVTKVMFGGGHGSVFHGCAGMTKKFETVTHPFVWAVLSHVCYQLPCMWESPRRRSDIMLCVKLDTVQHGGRDWENRGKWEIAEKKLDKWKQIRPGVWGQPRLCTLGVSLLVNFIFTQPKKTRALHM